MSSSTEQMQRQIQSLTDKLAAVKMGAGGKAKRKNAAGPLSPSVVSSRPGGSGRKRKNRAKGAVGGQGVLSFARKEKVADVTIRKAVTADSGSFDIVPSSFTFLRQFTMFDKVKWNKLQLFYRPGVGATFNGFVSYGVLWDFSKSSANRDQISALTPNMSHALWFDGQQQPMNLPTAKLQTRPWFTPDDTKDVIEQGPGRVFWAATTTDTAAADRVVGEIWADYSIVMTGTSF